MRSRAHGLTLLTFIALGSMARDAVAKDMTLPPPRIPKSADTSAGPTFVPLTPPPPRKRKSTVRLEDSNESPPSITLDAFRAELNSSPGERERASLQAQRQDLEQTAAQVAVARAQLREDAAKLENLFNTAQTAGLVPQRDGTAGKPRQPLETLAKAMRGMRPQQAAPIMERVPKELAADVLQRMPSADAGKVMGNMRPDKAADVAAEIASRQHHDVKGSDFAVAVVAVAPPKKKQVKP